MTQKPIDLKGKKILRSVELNPDLRSEAVRRILNELNQEAMVSAKRKPTTVVIYSE
jgi:DNA-binding protein YbaB